MPLTIDDLDQRAQSLPLIIEGEIPADVAAHARSLIGKHSSVYVTKSMIVVSDEVLADQISPTSVVSPQVEQTFRVRSFNVSAIWPAWVDEYPGVSFAFDAPTGIRGTMGCIEGKCFGYFNDNPDGDDVLDQIAAQCLSQLCDFDMILDVIFTFFNSETGVPFTQAQLDARVFNPNDVSVLAIDVPYLERSLTDTDFATRHRVLEEIVAAGDWRFSISYLRPVASAETLAEELAARRAMLLYWSQSLWNSGPVEGTGLFMNVSVTNVRVVDVRSLGPINAYYVALQADNDFLSVARVLSTNDYSIGDVVELEFTDVNVDGGDVTLTGGELGAIVAQAVAKSRDVIKQFSSRSTEFVIVKSGVEDRFTLGIVYEPTDESDVTEADLDFHGDFMEPAELERTAHEYLQKTRVVGLMHNHFGEDVGQVVESFIARTDMTFPMVDGSTQKVKKGAWLLGVIWTPSVWQLIKQGKLKGLSFGGRGRRVSVDLAS